MNSMAVGFNDLKRGFNAMPLWLTLAYNDIGERYRRTALGPWWLVVLHGAMVLGISILYSQIWNIDPSRYAVYLAAGVMAFNFFATALTESCQVFIRARPIVSSFTLPMSIHPFRFATGQFIVFLHHFLVYLVTITLCGVPWNAHSWMFFPALALAMVTAVSLNLMFGCMGARFRDLGPAIGSALGVMFMFTPILWPVSKLPEGSPLIMFNPLAHYVLVMREPLLGFQAPLSSWIFVVICTAVLLVASLFTFALSRNKIFYWT